jgi:hypothetical protein
MCLPSRCLAMGIHIKKKNTTFRKLDLFPLSGEGDRYPPTLLDPLERTNLNPWITYVRLRVRVRVTVRLGVYRLGAKPCETHVQRFIFQMNTCGHIPYVTPSLTRGWICHLQLLVVLDSVVVLRSRVPQDSSPHFTFSDSRPPQPGGPGPRIYIPQEQGRPVIPLGTRFPFRRLLRLAGLR